MFLLILGLLPLEVIIASVMWILLISFMISLFHNIKMISFLVFLIKVSFFSCFCWFFSSLLSFICFFVVHFVDYVSFFFTFHSIKMISIYISVSAATGNGSGMDFRSYPSYVQAPRWNLFLRLFVCPHCCFHCSFFCWFNHLWSFLLGYLGFGLPLQEISFMLLNFLCKFFYMFSPSTFQFM